MESFLHPDIPAWVKEFDLIDCLSSQCLVNNKIYALSFTKMKQDISLPSSKGVYFVFGSYYSPAIQATSTEVLTEDYVVTLADHLGL